MIDLLLQRVLFLVPLWLSLSVHEWAHAWTAHLLGDDTAKYQGRLTLNPLMHLDPVGTVLLPLLGVPFGWAKPVPVEPTHFRGNIRMENGMMLTCLAGPVSNLVLALGSVVLLLGLASVDWSFPGDTAMRFLLESLVILNVVLAVFNAIPVPPLDGSRIVAPLLPDGWKPFWHQLESSGPFLLIALLFLPRLLGFNPLGDLVQGLQQWLQHLLRH